MAHRIVWCSVATIDTRGRPRTRVLHPIWEFDGGELRGWIATDPTSAKRAHLDAHPMVSCTYWAPNHDTCTADCAIEWRHDAESRHALWQRFVDAPEPVGYDPAMIPGWEDADSPGFGVLEIEPWRLRVMPGSVLMGGVGETLTWER